MSTDSSDNLLDQIASRDGLGTFADELGLQVTEISPDHVRGQATLGSRHHQPYGIVHGGVYCSLVESAASMGAAAWMWGRGRTVGVTNITHFLRPMREGRLRIEARPIHRGRTQQLWQVELTDDADRLIARGEVRLANLYDD